MKYFLLIAACSVLFACSRRTVPPKGTNATIVTGKNTTTTATPNNNHNNISNNNNADSSSTADTSSAVNNADSFSFLVVTNGYGKIITQKDSLPADATIQWDAFQLSKGFSAQELSNLKARYKIIPPRVLYVNPQNEQQSARGTYYVLGKKFWYWKKKDGLFYLDEKYYL
jgi:hypothetical protein